MDVSKRKGGGKTAETATDLVARDRGRVVCTGRIRGNRFQMNTRSLPLYVLHKRRKKSPRNRGEQRSDGANVWGRATTKSRQRRGIGESGWGEEGNEGSGEKHPGGNPAHGLKSSMEPRTGEA